MKTYYFPNSKYVDRIFGSEMPCCIDKSEVDRLSSEWSNYDENGPTAQEIKGQFHVATEAEIAEYGVYDS